MMSYAEQKELIKQTLSQLIEFGLLEPIVLHQSGLIDLKPLGLFIGELPVELYAAMREIAIPEEAQE